MGFKQVSPSFFFGNAGPMLKLKFSMGEYYQDLYNKYKNTKLLGIYMFYRPNLVVNDAKLVQDIMIRDFTSFHDRPMAVDEENDPLSGKLKEKVCQKSFLTKDQNSALVQHSWSKMERFEGEVVPNIHFW